MKSNAFWLVVLPLAIFAILSFLFSYWMAGVGFAIVVIALLVSRGLQTRNPEATE